MNLIGQEYLVSLAITAICVIPVAAYVVYVDWKENGRPTLKESIYFAIGAAGFVALMAFFLTVGSAWTAAESPTPDLGSPNY